ncbi:MAG: hypothetical protein OEU36_20105 [Gammaproteobacteria bacterium]|nr:hypothetical protein [Gammaproteobacteria bacterium]
MGDADQGTSVAALAQKYKGIEGFYILNRNGDLGYIVKGTQSARKEAFPQQNDESFIKAHPNFAAELEKFAGHVKALIAFYSESPTAGMELGYVLPASDRTRSWHSATLVLNDHVMEAFKAYDEHLYQKGLKDPFMTDVEGDKLQSMRSVQRGLDDLINHKDQFGHSAFYPVLFVRSSAATAGADGDQSPLRILNLLWSHSVAEGLGETAPALGTVMDLLRKNVLERGAIDRSQRVENRFSIS